MIEIYSKHLKLRSLTSDDVNEKYVAWLNDLDINKFLETRHQIQTIQTCRDFVIRMNDSSESQLFGIFLGDSNEHIGNAKIGFIHEKYSTGQISLFIGEKKYWGKGFGSEVISCLTDYAFNNLNLARLEAGCYEDNISSLRSFLKSGYVVEGFRRSHVVSQSKRIGSFWLGILASEHNK